MPRIPAVDPSLATGSAKQLLDAVPAALGVTPSLMRTLAIAKARAAGLSGAEITEIMAHVAPNSLTTSINHVAQTTIDFPVVDIATNAA
jgi:hypothetical protein